MSSILCRLCARTDENGSVVVGDERLRKRIPLRIQDFLALDFQNESSKCVTICRNCQTMVETIDNFFYKVQAAQKIWAAINIEVQENEENKLVITQKPKRREAKLVPFLVRSLDSGCFRGLVWEDRNLGLFRLPWPRQGTNKWRPEDSQLFKEWAILKGRYCEKEDFVLWKTCIRTSLHKLPNVKEVRELHNFSANPPYKVYRITDFPEGFLAMSKSVYMDHNYIKSDENSKPEETVEVVEEEAVEEISLPEGGPSQTSPVQPSYFEKAEDVAVCSVNAPVLEIKIIEDQGSSVNDSFWIIAQEETIGNEEDNKFSSTLTEMPSQETVARWIQDLKRSASIDSKHNHYLHITPMDDKHLGKDDSQNSSDAQEDHFSSRDSHSSSKSNLSHTGSDMSLHMSCSSDEEDGLFTLSNESLDKKSSETLGGQSSSKETPQSRNHRDSSYKNFYQYNIENNKSKNSGKEIKSSDEDYKPPSSLKKTTRRRRRGSLAGSKAPERMTRRRASTSTIHMKKKDASIEKNYSSQQKTRSKKHESFSLRGRKRQWSPSNSGRKRECPECGKQFGNVCELVKHRQSCRQNTQRNSSVSKSSKENVTGVKSLNAVQPVLKKYSRNHKCNICNTSFKTAETLEEHLNTHWNLKYECKLCEECFFSSQELQEHIKSHSKS